MAEIVSLDEVNDALNLDGSSDHDDELQLYIDAVTAHVADRFGVLPDDTVTEIVYSTLHDDGVYRILPTRPPVLEVTSITDTNGTEYTTGFSVSADGWIEHDNLAYGGRWTVTYSAGFASVPADLKLAALEDIRGLYQPGQIGPPAAFGAFGIPEPTDTGTGFRPVRMWPRVDAWLKRRLGPGIA